MMGFCIWKVLVPLALIVMMSWAVFWIDPAELARRQLLTSRRAAP